KNYSVGRASDAPFEQIGAAWIRGPELAQFLNTRLIPGVRVYPTRFNDLQGVRFVITNRELFSSVRLGLEIAYGIEKLYPGKIDPELSRSLIGNRRVIDAIKAGEDPTTTIQRMDDSVKQFLERRKPFLLY